MWFRDVEFPQELIDAHRTGALVIFVGAGASMGSPSGLPSFSELARGVAADVGEEVTDEALKQPDVVLGRIDDRPDVDVHRLVAQRIGVAGSSPNALHRAVVDLASAGPQFRVVTTNFDRHLSSALTDLDAAVEEYEGPALPMGDDFTGLVYLHGSLGQEPRHLVVTDRDLGCAYLRDPWAARFLERMFFAHTILFIGYSHNDSVMRYLARSLGQRDGRYILTPNPDAQEWPSLGVRPMGYHPVDDSHQELVDAVEAWASWTKMGLLEHRQRIEELLWAPQELEPEDDSYLKDALADGEQVWLFTEFARGSEWLNWASSHPEFERLFDLSAAQSDCTTPLAYWFAEHFVMVEEHQQPALQVVRDAGGRLSPLLWSAIGRHLHGHEVPRPEWTTPWIVLMIRCDPGGSQPWLGDALKSSRWPEDRDVALLLFDHLTEPSVTLASSRSPRLRGDPHSLLRAWKDLFVPNLGEAVLLILVIVDRHLRQADRLLRCSNSAGLGHGTIAAGRAAVEPHELNVGDDGAESVDFLINAARDSLAAVLDSGLAIGPAYLEAWSDSNVPILERLAVHGWTHRTDVSSTDKIRWLRERGWLFDDHMHHEAYRLMAEALPAADRTEIDLLVADVQRGAPSWGDGEDRAYSTFTALAWINQHTPDLDTAQRALVEVRGRYPHFREPRHPDLLVWVETGWPEPNPPMSPTLLHERIADDVAAAVAELRRYEQHTNVSDGPTWQAVLTLLTDTVRDHPADGFAVLGAADGDRADIDRAVIRGWGSADVGHELPDRILRRLSHLDVQRVADELSRFLRDGGASSSHPTEWHRYPTARALADKVWSALDREQLAEEAEDWLHEAVNHPAGQLAMFWVRATAGDWKAAGDNWDGLPPKTRASLEMLLSGDDRRTALAEVVIGSQLQFFFAADREWCEEHVLSLLAWDNLERARRTWDGFLLWGRLNDRLLSAGLLEQYLATADNLEGFSERSRWQLCRHLARVATRSELDDPLDWMHRFTSSVDEEHRVRWMSEVAGMLGKLPPPVVELQWQRWMRPYWHQRLDGIPRELSETEATAMARWVVHLTDSISEAVDMATRSPAGLGEGADILRSLDESRIGMAPAACARLVGHLLKHTSPPFWHCSRLKEIVSVLRQEPELDLREIITGAIRLGCRDAASW